jgi:heme A synthase
VGTIVGGAVHPVTGSRGGFARFAWAVVAYNLVVVLWGAVVRATGSGAGCGGHWPLCNGEWTPRSPTLETLIEFTHRAMSGLALASVAVLCVWAFRRYARGSPLRTAAVLSAAFLCLEALLGAGLVLFGYVARNVSLGRAFYLALHLANTQMLLASLTATAWLASRPETLLAWRNAPRPVLAALPLTVLLGMTGAVAALGDTLFPASSVGAALSQDFSGAAHFLVRLRAVHPALAIVTGACIFYAASAAMKAHREARNTALAVWLLVLAQIVVGAVNIALLAPVWMQIVHLLVADLLWIALVLLALRTAAGRTEGSSYADLV